MKAREGEGVFASTPGTCRFLENKKPSTLTSKVLGSGDVLLSHGLSPYYHRGCSVSLPCSEWERVGPLRDNHQKLAPKAFEANFWCVIRDSLKRYIGRGRPTGPWL